MREEGEGGERKGREERGEGYFTDLCSKSGDVESCNDLSYFFVFRKNRLQFNFLALVVIDVETATKMGTVLFINSTV